MIYKEGASTLKKVRTTLVEYCHCTEDCVEFDIPRFDAFIAHYNPYGDEDSEAEGLGADQDTKDIDCAVYSSAKAGRYGSVIDTDGSVLDDEMKERAAFI